MANTNTTLIAQLTNTTGGVTVSGAANLPLNQNNAVNFTNAQSIATSSTAITVGGVSSAGYIWIKNTDATNYVEINSITAVAGGCPIHLGPGEACVLPTRLTTWYGIANTAAVVIDVVLVSI